MSDLEIYLEAIKNRPPNKGGVSDKLESSTRDGLSERDVSAFINAKATRVQRGKVVSLLGEYKIMPGYRVRSMEYMRYDGAITIALGYTVEHRHGPYLQIVRYSVGSRGKLTEH